MHFTRSESLQKASWWAPLKCSARGSSSHLYWGSSPGWDSGSLSPEGSNSTSHPGKCCCLVPLECVVVVGLLGQEGEGMGSLDLIVSCGVAVRRPVRGMFPVNKCMGYISTPRSSLGQAWRLLHRPAGRVGEHTFPPHGLIFQGLYGFLVDLL